MKKSRLFSLSLTLLVLVAAPLLWANRAQTYTEAPATPEVRDFEIENLAFTVYDYNGNPHPMNIQKEVYVMGNDTFVPLWQDTQIIWGGTTRSGLNYFEITFKNGDVLKSWTDGWPAQFEVSYDESVHAINICSQGQQPYYKQYGGGCRNFAPEPSDVALAKIPVHSRGELDLFKYTEEGLLIPQIGTGPYFYATPFNYQNAYYRAFERDGQFYIRGEGRLWRIQSQPVFHDNAWVFDYDGPYKAVSAYTQGTHVSTKGENWIINQTDIIGDAPWRVPFKWAKVEVDTAEDGSQYFYFSISYPSGEEVWRKEGDDVLPGEDFVTVKDDGQLWHIPRELATERGTYMMLPIGSGWCDTWTPIIGVQGCANYLLASEVTSVGFDDKGQPWANMTWESPDYRLRVMPLKGVTWLDNGTIFTSDPIDTDRVLPINGDMNGDLYYDTDDDDTTKGCLFIEDDGGITPSWAGGFNARVIDISPDGKQAAIAIGYEFKYSVLIYNLPTEIVEQGDCSISKEDFVQRFDDTDLTLWAATNRLAYYTNGDGKIKIRVDGMGGEFTWAGDYLAAWAWDKTGTALFLAIYEDEGIDGRQHTSYILFNPDTLETKVLIAPQPPD